MRCFSVVTLFVFCRRPSSGAPNRPRDSSRASSKWWRYYHETSQPWPGLCCYRSLKIKRKKMILHLQLQYLFLGLTWMICRLPLLFLKESHKNFDNQLFKQMKYVLVLCNFWQFIVKFAELENLINILWLDVSVSSDFVIQTVSSMDWQI